MKINIQNNEFKILMFCLAAIVAIVSVLPEMVYADDVVQSEQYLVQDGYSGQYANRDDNPHITGYYKGKLTLEESQKHIAFYITKKDGNNLNLGVEYDSKYLNWNNDFYWTATATDFSTGGSCLMTNQFNGKLKYYIFNTKEEAQAYIKTGDTSGATNPDDMIEDKGDYDESLPYYDKAVIEPIDAKKYSMQFSAAMNSGRVKDLYNLRDEGYELYYTFESYGVYMDSNIWTSISRIFETVGLTSSFTQKVKENITIDSSGRLVVGKAYSGGGGRHSGTLFKTLSSNNCNVYAVELDGTVTTSSKLSTGQNYTKDLNAKIFNGGDAGNLLFGVNGSANLIGYYAIIQPYIIKDGTIIYAKPTYAYNWVYKSLRDALGNGAYNYDPTNPDEPVDPVNPPGKDDPDPDPDNPDPVDPIDPSSFDLVAYLKLCMTEAKSFILLFNMWLTAIPAAIWVLITAAMTLNLLVIIFKIVRGM